VREEEEPEEDACVSRDTVRKLVAEKGGFKRA